MLLTPKYFEVLVRVLVGISEPVKSGRIEEERSAVRFLCFRSKTKIEEHETRTYHSLGQVNNYCLWGHEALNENSTTVKREPPRIASRF
jgi:hypothetical protein